MPGSLLEIQIHCMVVSPSWEKQVQAWKLPQAQISLQIKLSQYQTRIYYMGLPFLTYSILAFVKFLGKFITAADE